MSKVTFIIASTEQGTFILPRFDHSITPIPGGGDLHFGVGYELMEEGTYEGPAVLLIKTLLNILRKLRDIETRKTPLIVVDIGANIGTHTIAWGRHMRGWGVITAVEPQRTLFYALCGNIAINNLTTDVMAIHAALGNTNGKIDVPELDYTVPSSYGSLELTDAFGQDIGQDKTKREAMQVNLMTLDALQLPWVDFIKIDVEGMEPEVLEGAVHMIETYHPVLYVEFTKSDQQKLCDLLKLYEYTYYRVGSSLLCAHKDDPVLDTFRPGK